MTFAQKATLRAALGSLPAKTLARGAALLPLISRAALLLPPIVELLCGWMTTEVGRQANTVCGTPRTTNRVSPQFLLLVGAAVLIPLNLLYSGLSYWVCRRTIKEDAHYH